MRKNIIPNALNKIIKAIKIKAYNINDPFSDFGGGVYIGPVGVIGGANGGGFVAQYWV